MDSLKGIVKQLEDQITESESGAYDVGEQRERNHRYYSQQPLGNEQKGRSHYIDPSVMDAVESKKALFSETFLSNRQTVKFKSGGAQTPHEADAKTAYAMQVLRKNRHEQLFRDGWHDAFVAKRMVAMVGWKEDTKEVELDLQAAMPQQVQQLVASQGQVVDVDDSQLQQDMMPSMQGPVPMLSGPLKVVLDDSQVTIELVQPERFYRDPMSSYPQDSQWCAVEKDLPRGTLINLGYDPEQVNGLSVDYRFRSDEEDAARKAHDQSWTRRMQYDRAGNQQHITTYKTWTWLNLAEDAESMDLQLDFEPSDEILLYEIHWAHGEILSWANGTTCIKEAEEMPFFEWTEMKVSHAEFGLCTADIMANTQKTNSTLKRLVIDNQQMRNNTRWEAAIGALKNPRDLLDSRIGGVVWSRQIGSVAPLATPELSPMTMDVINMLRDDGERRDGYSGLGKGTNGDAIRYQNADSMIERLTSAGTRRPMNAARDWALNWLIPVCQHIVKVGMQNDKTQTELEVCGRMIPIVPSQWSDDDVVMDIAVALTPQEGKEHAQNLLMMHQTISQDPEMGLLYGASQKHALFDAVYDALGVSDTTQYLGRPDSPEYQQAVQMQQQQMQAEQQKQEQMVQMQMGLAQSADQREWDSLEWTKTQDMDKANRDEKRLEHDMNTDQAKLVLDWQEFDQKKDNDEAELELERSQRRPVSVGN